MNKLWIDIDKDPENQFFKIGFLIVNKNEKVIKGYETQTANLYEVIAKIVEENQIDEIFHFNESEESFNILQSLYKIPCKIIDIAEDYKKIFNALHLQLSKNSDIAAAFNIKIDYYRLHNPLYDIQLSYCGYHNFKISTLEKRQDYLYDSLFVLTNKFDALWKIKMNYHFNYQNISPVVIRPKKIEKRYFLDCNKLNDAHEITLIDYDSNQKQTLLINKDNVLKVIELFENNAILFLSPNDARELSIKIWDINNQNQDLKQNIGKKQPLYVFFGIYLSRFKLFMLNYQKIGYTLDNLKVNFDGELSINNLKRINKI